MVIPVDWETRPKDVPSASESDKIFEVFAFTGTLLSIIIVVYSAATSPDIITNHQYSLAGMSIYVSKLLMLAMFPIFIMTVFALITAFYWFPYILVYPEILTGENAPRLYRNTRNKLCRAKPIIIWISLIIEWFFTILLLNNPDLSSLFNISYLIGLFFIIVLAIITVYAVKKPNPEGKPKTRYGG